MNSNPKTLRELDREIIRLSVPTIISNITIPLLGICDTAISGHLGSELFLSSIAVGSVMLNVVFWIFGFLRGGTTGLTANALGSGDRNEIAKVFYRGLIIALGAGMLLIMFRNPVFESLWWIAGSDGEIEEDVRIYFMWRIWGSPALLSTIAISGWFVGMQTTFYPMLIAVVQNVLNMVASYMLAFNLGYGFEGVAIGTMVSNWIGLGIAGGCMLWFLKGKVLKCTLQSVIKGEWWRYFSVNGNLFLRSLFIICVTMGITAAGGRISYYTLAVNVIVMQFFQFFSFFVDGFAYSGEAMVGLRAGEGNLQMLKKSVRRLLQWTFVTGLLFSIGYFFGAGEIASLLTDSGNVAEGVASLSGWIAFIPIVSCLAFIFDGFYIGITDTFKMMVSSLLGAVMFFGILWINFTEYGPATDFGKNMLIWTSFLLYLLARGLYLATSWKSSLSKLYFPNNKEIAIEAFQ